MTRTRILATMVLALAVTLCGGRAPVRAEDTACKAEIEKLCPGMKPGDGKYGQCLVDHEKDFSSGCKKYAHAAAARKRDLKELPTCIDDAERFCPGLKVGLTRLMKCLRTNQGKLSSDCKSEIGKRTGKYY